VYQERFSTTAFSDRPAFWMLDNDRAAVRLKYAESDPAAVAKEFRRLREDTLVLLRALPHAAWRRTGLHPKRGELTLEQLAEVLAGHDDSHIGKIKASRG
jgi:hypothetical protein